ncbi:MAG: hypothetical protein ACKV2T_25215 [Kofleriaceae bacterium]
MITSILVPVVIGFGVLGLIAFFRKPVDMRAAAGAWKTPIPSKNDPGKNDPGKNDPAKRAA